MFNVARLVAVSRDWTYLSDNFKSGVGGAGTDVLERPS